jgi:hypothetical protein
MAAAPAFPLKRKRTLQSPGAQMAVEVADADELALFALSDFDLALQTLWADCPPALLRGRDGGAAALPPLALRAQVYDLLHDRTLVDRAWEAALTDPALVALHLAALGEDALAPAPRVADALRAAAAAADAAADAPAARALRLAAGPLLARCRGRIGAADLLAVYGAATAPAARDALCARGFLAVVNGDRHGAGAGGGDAAAPAADGSDALGGGWWAWALPTVGVLSRELGVARRASVDLLASRPFHELAATDVAARVAALNGRAAGATRAVLRKPTGGGACALDWRFTERFLCGAGVLQRKAVGLRGSVLFLADVDAARRMAAQPRPHAGAR